jgi:hypothetical protein
LQSITVFVFALLLIATSTTGIAIGQSGDGPVDEMKLIQRAGELQDQLGSEDLEQRSDAESALIELGVIALEYLDPITDETPSDTVERLNRIRKTLEKQAAASFTKPKLVSLNGEFTITEAIEAIQKQTGNKIVLPGGAPEEAEQKKIKLKLDKATFWRAVDELSKASGMQVNTIGGTAGQLTLVPTDQPLNNIPKDASGIFQTSVLQISATRNLEKPQLDYCGLRIRVRWEPRLSPITLAIPAKTIKVVDEFDDTIAIPNPEAVLSAGVQAEIPEVEFSIPIGLVDRQVEKLSSISFQLDAVLPGRKESFEFEKLGRLENGYRQSKAGASLSLEGLVKNEDLYGVTLKLAFDETSNALESHLSWVYENEVKLIDKDGNEHLALAQESAGRSENAIAIRYYFSEDPAAMNLIYKTPAAIVSTPIQIKLVDIPLP